MKLSDIDWKTWEPTEHATLLFIFEGSRVLLIHKKRGLGAGKINGPGGRLEPGETAREAAIREVQEEVCVTPTGVSHAGTLRFQFIDGYAIQGEVFKATGYEGTPTETDEATPAWFDTDKLPYDRMWADDEHWMPHMLAGRPFDGRFVFDDDTMLDMHIDTKTV